MGSIDTSLTNGHTPRPLLLLAPDSQFDTTIAEHFNEEGFRIHVLEPSSSASYYHDHINSLIDSIEPNESFAIVTYGKAASHILDLATSPLPKLSSLTAYHPSSLPTVSSLHTKNLLIHLAGDQNFGSKLTHIFRYPGTSSNFAFKDSPTFDKAAATNAWSRTLTLLRQGFNLNKAFELEQIWDYHCELEFATRDAAATMGTMIPEPYVNHIPTMTGGIGYKDLFRFYRDFFIPNNPPDMGLKILSRTVGADRVVDEMLIDFTHTCEVPWMLPGIPATGKRVEIIVVGVIGIRGGKLHHEHIHWDQASVLVQVGLLDPKLIPASFRDAEGKGGEGLVLPVVGAEGARKCADEEVGASNLLIKGW